jgi:hypothetical protein
MLPLAPAKPFLGMVKRQYSNENRNMQCQEEREEDDDHQSHCVEYGHNTPPGKATKHPQKCRCLIRW